MERDDSRQARLEAIKELVKGHAIEDQQGLAALLKQNYGLEVNQSIVSKDLHLLGISKQKVGSKMVYELPTTDATREILRRGVINIKRNEALIVIKTQPGLADFVGDYVDAHHELGILGCIAGENVVFIAPASIKNIDAVHARLTELLHIKK